MNTLAGISTFIEEHTRIVDLLHAVNTIAGPGFWIGAGFIRNAVWDELHGICSGPSLEPDVDVIYFDLADASAFRDATIQAQLLEHMNEIKWSVHNQARMHIRNGDSPYLDLDDAMRHWPETATAIAARICGKRVEVLAPLGIDDLIGLIVRPAPCFRPQTRCLSRAYRHKELEIALAEIDDHWNLTSTSIRKFVNASLQGG